MQRTFDKKTTWQIGILGEVCEIIAGQSPEGKFYNNSGKGLPFYQGKKEFTKKYIGAPTTWTMDITKEALKDDILMSVRAPVGPVNFATEKICIGRGLAAIRSTEKIYKDYLFYFLQKYEDEIVGNAGAVFNSINKTQIENIKIPLPPLPEQKRIVVILDEMFEKTAKAKENAEKNLQNAHDLFESYLQGVFANPGDGWEEMELGEVAEVFGGFAFKSSEFTKAGKYQVLRMGNVRPGLIRIDESPVFIDKINEKTLSRSLLRRDDVIITQTGTRKKRDYGYTVVVDKDNYLLNQRLAVIRFSGNFNHRFFLYFSWSDKFRDQFFANETGTVGQGNVGIGAVTGAFVPVPSIVEQKRIVAKLDALSAETKKLEVIYQQKLTDLDELRKSILQKAFNGELAGACS